MHLAQTHPKLHDALFALLDAGDGLAALAAETGPEMRADADVNRDYWRTAKQGVLDLLETEVGDDTP